MITKLFGVRICLLNPSHRVPGISVFVSPNVYRITQRKSADRDILLRRCYKLELFACLYDEYSTRYEFLKNFKGFVLLSPSAAEVNKIINLPTLCG